MELICSGPGPGLCCAQIRSSDVFLRKNSFAKATGWNGRKTRKQSSFSVKRKRRIRAGVETGAEEKQGDQERQGSFNSHVMEVSSTFNNSNGNAEYNVWVTNNYILDCKMECAAMAANRGAMAATTNLPRFSSSSITRLAANSSYYDRNHLQYYGGAVKVYCGKKTKLEKQAQKGLSALHDGSLSEKRRTKLLELVAKDISAFSNTIAEGKDVDKSLVEEVRGQILSGALQVVMIQLEQVKAERKQREREMKAQKKAAKAQKKLEKNCEDVSSSSSESSDSICDHLHMTQPANLSMIRIPEPPQTAGHNEVVVPDAMATILVENPTNMAGLHQEFAETKERLGLSGVEVGCRQVQVCTGGKCKKLGSEQLLAAFEESIQKSGMGCAVEAVGCKCMGKCRNAPNVRVQNDYCKELYMGVGMGDVDLVLDHHFGLKAEENELKSNELIQI